jgi:hypothetical protein
MWCFGNHRGKNLKKFKKGHCLKVKNKQTSMLNWSQINKSIVLRSRWILYLLKIGWRWLYNFWLGSILGLLSIYGSVRRRMHDFWNRQWRSTVLTIHPRLFQIPSRILTRSILYFDLLSFFSNLLFQYNYKKHKCSSNIYVIMIKARAILLKDYETIFIYT